MSGMMVQVSVAVVRVHLPTRRCRASHGDRRTFLRGCAGTPFLEWSSAALNGPGEVAVSACADKCKESGHALEFLTRALDPPRDPRPEEAVRVADRTDAEQPCWPAGKSCRILFNELGGPRE